MKANLSLILAGAMTAAVVSGSSFLPANYEASSAAVKQEALMNLLESTTGTSGKFPSPLGLLAFLARDNISPTVTAYTDELPYSNEHEKRIHSIGAVCSATFEAAADTPFTGMFTGNKHVIARLSVAAEPEKEKITPGIAVKFLRDGIPSANFVAMYSLEGQKSLNFFENDFSNHVKSPTSFILKKLAKKFQSVSDPAEMVGLSDIAATGTDGVEIKADDRQFPFEIIMTPNPALNLEFEELSNIKKGTILYNMFARVSPEDEGRIPIGNLRATSDVFFSKAGDEILFFRHQKMSEDVELRPEWSEAVNGKKSFLGSILEGKGGCPLGYKRN